MKKLPKPLVMILKAALAVALLAWMLSSQSETLTAVWRESALLNRALFGVAVLVLVNFMAIYRWKIVMEAHGLFVPYRDAFRASLIGCFFNNVTPGGIAGDVLKAALMATKTGANVVVVASSDIMDRFVGLTTLMAIGLVFTLGSGVGEGLKSGQMVMGAVFLMAFLGLSSVFLGWPSRVIRKLLGRMRIGRVLADSFQELETRMRDIRSQAPVIRRALRLAVIQHLVAFFAFWQLTQIFVSGPQLAAVIFPVLPWALLFSSVPALPGGVGTGHAAFEVTFGWVGIPNGAEVYTFYMLHLLVVTVLGALFFVSSRWKKGDSA